MISFRRFLTATIVLFITILAQANMASPIQGNSWSASPFLSDHVDITHEKIFISLDDSFNTAKFNIEYHINAKKSGVQVPLLFYATEFKDSFRIWIDGHEIFLNQVPEAYRDLNGTPFSSFDYFFQNNHCDSIKEVVIWNSSNRGFHVDINDLKFFETDITKGEHLIKVEYTANHWQYSGTWISERWFRYILSPAKYWKSFGSLEIHLDASQFQKPIKTNLGAPTSGKLQEKCIWQFDEMPIEILQIEYAPKISKLSSALIFISPIYFMYGAFLLLAIWHFYFLRKFRNSTKKNAFSISLFLGSLLVPFLAFLVFILSYTLIDLTLGEKASGYHGYEFMIYIFYPIVMPAYWLIIWLIYHLVKKIELKKNCVG
ncbi:MAG: hypothetical protein ACPGLV_15015 [Bacteroidia bacterium]